MFSELIILLLLPMLVLLTCVWFRFNPRPNLSLIPTCCLAVVLIGSVFGHTFLHVSVGPLPITLDRLLLGASILFFAWRFLTGREELQPLNGLDIAVIAWLAVISISTLTSDFKAMNNMPLSRLLFFNWLPAMLYFIARQCRYSIADLKFVLLAMGCFGVYLALTAIAEVKSLEAFIYPKYIITAETREFLGRGRGPFLNPVANGSFMAVCFCCVLAWWPRVSVKARYALVAISTILAIGVYATLTRSNWIALAAACGFFIFLPATRKAKGWMVVVATVASIALFPIISEKVFSFKRDKDVSVADMEQSAQLRPLFVLVAWDMFKDRPINGVGFGQYAKAKYPYLRTANTTQPLRLTQSFMQHNVFLAYLTESGLIGVAGLLLLLSQSATVSWRVWKNKQTDLVARQMGLAGLALLSCYLINGMFHDVSIVPQMHMLMMLWLGITNNVYSKPEVFSPREGNSLDAIELELPGRSAWLQHAT